ncbi:MAG TPA: protein-tyrosine-phosphatase [Parvularcula sp.]|nr:protein-tyrosine-phosphatase [Parvularcula sp.]HBS33137.1 protein-tyrosine-phosphatase [Parvularcula sp.]HBS34235.1 protein-tyrosine-phosphatase [Parvularcula sp.]
MDKILFVDAGNYSRSPAAEVIAKTHFEKNLRGLAVVFSSAGLKDKHVGGGADPRTIEECARRGYDLSAFRCRQIGAADFNRFDLILAMDRSNLEGLEALRPAGARARLDLFIPDGEVPDPFFGGADGFVVAIGLIERRIAELATEMARGV